jgi:hypothetical protein
MGMWNYLRLDLGIYLSVTNNRGKNNVDKNFTFDKPQITVDFISNGT